MKKRMVNNPYTTISGYAALLGAAVMAAMEFKQSRVVSPGTLTALLAALAGVGLISAKDGGH
mgnify:CR=1 FL=1